MNGYRWKQCTLIVTLLHCFKTVLSTSTGCHNTSNIKHWSVSKESIEISSYDSTNCVTIKDPTTFTRHHGYPALRKVETLQGNHPQYTCRVEPRCSTEFASLLLGSAATCDVLPTTKTKFQVKNKDLANCIDSCTTKIEMKIITSTVALILRIDKSNELGFHFDAFKYLEFSYQTCMEETLEFQIPLSASVPLKVTCTEYLGKPLLDERCLLSQVTISEMLTTDLSKENVTEVTSTSLNCSQDDFTVGTAVHEKECSDPRDERIWLIVGCMAAGILLIVLILGAIFYFVILKPKLQYTAAAQGP